MKAARPPRPNPVDVFPGPSWLKEVTETPPEELCTDGRMDDDMTSPVSQLATIALAIEPIVRG